MQTVIFSLEFFKNVRKNTQWRHAFKVSWFVYIFFQVVSKKIESFFMFEPWANFVQTFAFFRLSKICSFAEKFAELQVWKNEPISNFYLKVTVICTRNWCLQYHFEFNREFIKWRKKIVNCSEFDAACKKIFVCYKKKVTSWESIADSQQKFFCMQKWQKVRLEFFRDFGGNFLKKNSWWLL